MKYMVISDMHGGINELNKVLDIYVKEQCSKLLILGDLFDYGFNINNQDIVNRLNIMKDNIIAVIGNCDNDLRGILFDENYLIETELNDKKIILTHGHLYTKKQLLDKNKDIIFYGHSHIGNIDRVGSTLLVNPGSISKSRQGENSFAIVDENKISIRNLNNESINEYTFEEKQI